MVFLQNLVNALQWGSFYALIALGYSMVYSILMLFNFAHGDIFMVGAYIGFGVSSILAVAGGLPAFAGSSPGFSRHYRVDDRHYTGNRQPGPAGCGTG